MAPLLMFLNLLLISFLAKATLSSNDFQQRILYGENVKIEDYPFYAGLRIEYEESGCTTTETCGAAIISDTWIITAAHCALPHYSNKIGYVSVGGESFDNSIQVSYNKVIIHEKFHRLSVFMEFGIGNLLFHDVALIRLASPLTFSKKVQPIDLPMSPVTDPYVEFVGRGRDETGKATIYLKKVDLIRLTMQQCISSYPPLMQNYAQQNVNSLEESTTCAKRKGDLPSVCYGDSGGPLFNGNTLVGLASYLGNRTCDTTRLAFYVNVASYVPWIMNNIRP